MVLHVDACQASTVKGFEGSKVYLIACCGMYSFAAMEPVSNASAKSFASAFICIILRYGFCRTVVLDKNTKFMRVFKESLNLLNINYHILSGNNHNPMLIEHLNCCLNEGLCIMLNKHDSVQIALEAILLLIYAWNSCPMLGTDICCSLVAVGLEFSFPNDFSSVTHTGLIPAPGAVTSYSCFLVERLDTCHAIAKLLVHEQCCWHRELINSCHLDPCAYSVG
jgi:hypothetical protein